jgi:hypothetical protein
MRYFNVAIAGPVGTSYEGKKNCTNICVWNTYIYVYRICVYRIHIYVDIDTWNTYICVYIYTSMWP